MALCVISRPRNDHVAFRVKADIKLASSSAYLDSDSRSHDLQSREGDLTLTWQGKTLGACALGFNRGKLSMTFVRSVTMLSLAREALERCDNDASAAQAYLSERLLNDAQLREALVKSAIEYERFEMMES